MSVPSWMRALLAAATVAALIPGARAADEPPMHAVRLLPGERIVLDGTLSHPAWQRAPVFERSHEIEPVRGRTPTHPTHVRVLYDDQALYVGVDAIDPEPAQIRGRLVRHDLVLRTQDFVVLYIDPIGARKSAQFFRVGAAGSTADGLHTASTDTEDFAPDFDFDAATARHARGYSAVFRVPYASLRYTASSRGGWRIMVGRRVPRDQVMLTLSVPLPREALSFIDALQPLAGFEPPLEHGFVQWRPTLTLRRADDRPFGAPRQRETEAQPSLDVKWRPRPELVLDATLNPDFAQVALDRPQLSRNTRFALLLAEKRPFFLESYDLLGSPTDALYTRSINDPRWGLRATWRGDRLTGSGIALADKGGGLTPLPGPYATGFALQPSNRTLLSRAQWHLGSVTLGGLASARDYGEGAGDNRVAGVDGQWLAGDSLRLKAQVLGSETTALDDGRGVLRAGPARRGGLVHLGLFGRTGRSETELSFTELSHGFRNDAGFVVQAGIRKLVANQNRQWFELGPLNQLNLYLNTQRIEERGTRRTVLQRWTPGAWMAGPYNSQLVVELNPDEKSRVQRDGPLHDARYVHLWAQGSPPLSWLPLAEAWYDAGRLVDVGAGVDGRVVGGRKFGFDLQFRPLHWLELQPRLDAVDLDNRVEGRWRETAAQLLAIAHLAPRRSVRLIVQRHGFRRGSGAEQLDTARSLTYAWRPSAGTALYVGATRIRSGLPAAPASGTEVFAKLQFDFAELALWR